VLVSVLVLSVGLLGAAALQLGAVRNNQSNYEQAQMTVLSQGMLDSMRSNLAGVTAGAYQTGGYTCTAPAGATLAATDLAQWLGGLQTQINPSACGSINCVGSDCTVGIRWNDSRATGGSAAQAFTLRSRL
jgi:type IV pilus assembly protein PilV